MNFFYSNLFSIYVCFLYVVVLKSVVNCCRKLCCSTIKSLFVNEGKHRGEATVEAVRLIADHVKNHNCHLHPDSIQVSGFPIIECINEHSVTFFFPVYPLLLRSQVFMSLSFDDDIGRSSTSNIENNTNNKKSKRRNFKEPQDNDKKRSKRELLKKTRDEVSCNRSFLFFCLSSLFVLILFIALVFFMHYAGGCRIKVRFIYYRQGGEENDAVRNAFCCI